VFVEYQTGNLNVADFTVENGSFTGNIDTFDTGDVFQSFSENVISGKAQGIIDIKN